MAAPMSGPVRAVAVMDDRSIRRVLLASTASIVISVVAIVLRLASRKILRLPFQADDYTICFAGLLVVAISSIAIKYRALIPLAMSDEVFEKNAPLYAFWQLEGLALTVVRISVLLFYTRLFAASAGTRQRYLVLTLWVCVGLWFFINNFTLAFACNPMSHLFDAYYAGPFQCIELDRFFIFAQIFSIGLGIAILTVPFSAVYGLQVGALKKTGVAAVFLLGGLSMAITLARLIVFIMSLGKHGASHFKAFAYWTVLEPGAEIAAACLPTMGPLLNIRRHWRKLQSKGSESDLNSGRLRLNCTLEERVMGSRWAGQSDRATEAALKSWSDRYENRQLSKASTDAFIFHSTYMGSESTLVGPDNPRGPRLPA